MIAPFALVIGRNVVFHVFVPNSQMVFANRRGLRYRRLYRNARFDLVGVEFPDQNRQTRAKQQSKTAARNSGAKQRCEGLGFCYSRRTFAFMGVATER